MRTCQKSNLNVKLNRQKIGGVAIMNNFWASIVFLILGLIIGGVLGFYLTNRMYRKKEKENPPVNEKMIRAMYMQMGRKPSEAQIRQIMRSMGQ